MSKILERKSTNINSPSTMEISASDAGKVIGVDGNGNLTLTEGGGGSGDNVFKVSLSATASLFNDWTSDKTFSEIEQAYSEGKLILFSVNIHSAPEATDPFSEVYTGYAEYVKNSNAEYFALLRTENPATNTIRLMEYYIDSDNIVSRYEIVSITYPNITIT